MSSYNVTCEKSLTELNNHLSTNLFIGGHQPNAQDALTFEAFQGNAPDVAKYPSVTAWFYLVHCFENVRDSWKAISDKKDDKKNNKKEEKKGGDDDDLFGDIEETEEDKKKVEEKKKKAAEAAAKKKEEAEKAEKKKKVVVGKSLVILNVKVNSLETDFDDLFKKVTAIEKEGLLWKQDYKTPVVAYGMKMLVVGCVVVDDLISVDEDIINQLYELYGDKEDEEGEITEEGLIQSIDIASFDKI